MRRNYFLLCLIVISVLSVASGVSALTWNFSERTGWGDGNQPDGDIYGNTNVWKYQYVGAGDYNPAHYADMPTFIAGSHWEYYSVMCNVSLSGMHPLYSIDPIIRFIVQQTDIYDISLSMTDIHIGPHDGVDNGVNMILQYGKADSSITTTSQYIWRGSTQSLFIDNVTLNAGDIIIARINSVNHDGYDSTGINYFTITSSNSPSQAVPEPMSFLLFGVSAVSLVRRFLRR